VIHLLLCLSLVLSGAGVAAARVTMAAEAVLLHDVVICGAAGAHIVTLDATGKVVPRHAQDHCRTCPDCQITGAFALTASQTRAVAPFGLVRSGVQAVAAIVLPGRDALLPPSRAPPKEL
jgi:hypothetical protein